MEYYSAIKKKEIMPYTTSWMDLEIVRLSEVKSDREGEISDGIPYMCNIKRNDTNELMKEMFLTENKLMFTQGQR